MRRPLTLFLLLCAASTRVDAQFAGPRARLVEELRLDGAAEDFTFIDDGFVKVGSDGRIVVWQREDGQIRFYTAAGKRFATFGHKGRGPGEFGYNLGAGWLGDTLWTYDDSQKRFTFISPGVTLLRTAPLRVQVISGAQPTTTTPITAVALFQPLAVATSGAVLGSATLLTRTATTRSLERVYALSSATGEIGRIVARFPESKNPLTAAIAGAPHATPDGGVDLGTMWTIPFSTTPLRASHAIAPDGRRFALLKSAITSPTGGTIALAVFRFTGDTLLNRTYRFTGTPIPKAVIDAVVAPMPADLHEQAYTKIPKIYPPVDALVLGLDDSIWLQLHETVEGRPCVLLDARGDAVLTVMIPKSAKLVQARRNAVWTIEMDSDDIPSVVRYRIGS